MNIERLVAEFTAPAQQQFDNEYPGFIAAEPLILRPPMRMAQAPLRRRAVPAVLRMGAGLFAWKFADVRVGELVDLLVGLRQETPHLAAMLDSQNPNRLS